MMSIMTVITRAADLDAIRHDIDLLQKDIDTAHEQLDSPPPASKVENGVEPDVNPPCRPRAKRQLFPRLPHWGGISFRRHDKYRKLDDPELPLLGRRGSSDSEKTLVDTPPPVDSPGKVLGLLAPLISAIQGLTPRISGAHDLDDISMVEIAALRDAHRCLCDGLLALIDRLRLGPGSTGGPMDQEEMRDLLLDALTKKVEREWGAIHQLTAHTTVGAVSPRSSAVVKATFVAGDKNPFIVHSTGVGLNLAPRKTSIPSKSIPFASGGTGGIQQSIWRTNIIRLGSYQNSALFSPSPVAIQRGALGAGGKLK